MSQTTMADNLQRRKMGRRFAIVGAAGLTSGVLLAPLERVKLLLQSQNEIIKQGRLADPYRGIIDCFSRTIKSEGALALWRGALTGLAVQVSTHAILFTMKDFFKSLRKVDEKDGRLKLLANNVISGAASGGIVASVVYSLSFARARLANDVISAKDGPRQFKGLFDVYRQIWRSDGIAGLYRGIGVSYVGIVVHRGCFFGLYDTLKPLIGAEQPKYLYFSLAYVVTITAGLISYPFDTVRCRMLMRSGQDVKYKSSIDCATQIIKNEGAMTLWRGAVVSLLRGFVGASFLFGFDQIRYMRRFRKDFHTAKPGTKPCAKMDTGRGRPT